MEADLFFQFWKPLAKFMRERMRKRRLYESWREIPIIVQNYDTWSRVKQGMMVAAMRMSDHSKGVETKKTVSITAIKKYEECTNRKKKLASCLATYLVAKPSWSLDWYTRSFIYLPLWLPYCQKPPEQKYIDWLTKFDFFTLRVTACIDGSVDEWIHGAASILYITSGKK